MIGLILTIIIGLAIAYVSNLSTSVITLTLGNYSFINVPLLVFTEGTYVLGMLLAWIIEIPQTILSAFQVVGLGRTIRSGNNTIANLQKKISKLEMENTKLRESNNQSIIVNKQADGSYKPNRIQNFLHKINLR